MPTVIVEEAVAGLGLKLAVAPPGNPLRLKVTVAVKPPEGRDARGIHGARSLHDALGSGGRERLKSDTGAGLTVRVTDVVCVRVPLTPVMVNG